MAFRRLFDDQFTEAAPGYTPTSVDPFMGLKDSGMVASGLADGAAIPKAASMPGSDYTGLIGAGVGAAGQTVSTLAQLMASSAARQQALQNASANRDSNEKVARMRLDAAAKMADNERRQQAITFLLQALGHSGANTLKAFDTNRIANKQADNIIGAAYGF